MTLNGEWPIIGKLSVSIIHPTQTYHFEKLIRVLPILKFAKIGVHLSKFTCLFS